MCMAEPGFRQVPQPTQFQTCTDVEHHVCITVKPSDLRLTFFVGPCRWSH